jgi:colanic acid/amylovoran biosynthesis glycosyltransferase
MRLLFILYDERDYVTGPAVNLSRLLPRLAARGHEVHELTAFRGDWPVGRRLQAQGLRCHPLERPNYTEDFLKSILAVAEAVDPDVFVPDVSTPGCYAATWLKASGVVTVNTLRSDDALSWGKAIYFSDGHARRSTSAIVCVSLRLKKLLDDKAPKHPPAAVIPSGVPVPDFVADQKKPGLSVAYAGRLVDEQKRVPAMVKAFIAVAERHPQIRFTLIGGGPERERCEGLVRSSAAPSQFAFTGVLYEDELRQELARHHVIALLSDNEGVPGCLMDGMAVGLVPVSSAFCGVEELVQHGRSGMVVKDRGTGFEEALLRLADNPELRQRLGAGAREQIQEAFSLDTATDRWEDLLHALTTPPIPRHPFTAPRTTRLPPRSALLSEDLRRPSWAATLRGRVRLRTRVRRLWS